MTNPITGAREDAKDLAAAHQHLLAARDYFGEGADRLGAMATMIASLQKRAEERFAATAEPTKRPLEGIELKPHDKHTSRILMDGGILRFEFAGGSPEARDKMAKRMAGQFPLARVGQDYDNKLVFVEFDKAAVKATVDGLRAPDMEDSVVKALAEVFPGAEVGRDEIGAFVAIPIPGRDDARKAARDAHIRATAGQPIPEPTEAASEPEFTPEPLQRGDKVWIEAEVVEAGKDGALVNIANCTGDARHMHVDGQFIFTEGPGAEFAEVGEETGTGDSFRDYLQHCVSGIGKLSGAPGPLVNFVAKEIAGMPNEALFELMVEGMGISAEVLKADLATRLFGKEAPADPEKKAVEPDYDTSWAKARILQLEEALLPLLQGRMQPYGGFHVGHATLHVRRADLERAHAAFDFAHVPTPEGFLPPVEITDDDVEAAERAMAEKMMTDLEQEGRLLSGGTKAATKASLQAFLDRLKGR